MIYYLYAFFEQFGEHYFIEIHFLKPPLHIGQYDMHSLILFVFCVFSKLNSTLMMR